METHATHRPGTPYATRYASFLRAAQSSVRGGGRFTAEEIATKAAEQDSSVWHASNTLWREAFQRGEIPFDVCPLCGGSNLDGRGAHSLCAARAESGLPTPRLDCYPVPCDCARCRPSVRFA